MKNLRKILIDTPCYIQCPYCGFLGDLFGSDFDCMGGIKEGNVFCNRCIEQFNPKVNLVMQKEFEFNENYKTHT